MAIRISGATEHNLKRVTVEIPDGITAVTGVSGSGKSSLAFDTLYHEASRRLSELYRIRPAHEVQAPAAVDRIENLRPAVSVAQNVLNRNPNSTVATAAGIHPFLRLLFARFGTRHCRRCESPISHQSAEDLIGALRTEAPFAEVHAVLVPGAAGPHTTLLRELETGPGAGSIIVDGRARLEVSTLDPEARHRIAIRLPVDNSEYAPLQVIGQARSLGALVVDLVSGSGTRRAFALADLCPLCGLRYSPLDPVRFHQVCPACRGAGCARCGGSGRHPESLDVTVSGRGFYDFLTLELSGVEQSLDRAELPAGASGLQEEIRSRAASLCDLGLGYLQLGRSSPSLSRGEAQRLRLAVCLTSRLALLHVLDEPTIGLHTCDTANLMRALRRLRGPVVLVEHDPEAVLLSDHVIDLGPGGGVEGGRVTFDGPPPALWESDTETGRAFRESPVVPRTTDPPSDWIEVRGASANNLQQIDVRFPVGRLTVVSGVSGSGKSSLVHGVLAASLLAGRPVACESCDYPELRCTIVDQTPIGKNPRSNPATYTRLSGVIRDLFAAHTGAPRSLFSFNRKEGACAHCAGLGAIEVEMRYLPSTWHTCPECHGRRFTPEVLARTIPFRGKELSIADVFDLPIAEIEALFRDELAQVLPDGARRKARRIVRTLAEIGLGYLTLGQPSPTLSGGEAQRVKLSKYLGRPRLPGQLLILDEPSTGLHPANTRQLMRGLRRLVAIGTTIVVVEHNLDVIREADWIIDLGVGAGPLGGQVLHQGSVRGLLDCDESATARVLRERGDGRSHSVSLAAEPQLSRVDEPEPIIRVHGANVNNLREVDAKIPHRSLTVITGVSGSGKTSLVRDVIEAEARTRFHETLSIYERQGLRSRSRGSGAEIEGLGVTVAVDPARIRYSPRSTVGTATEIHHKLAVLLSLLGEGPRLPPEAFFRSTYSAACTACNGVGTTSIPNPHKLIICGDLPLCGGAMHSPGFFPKGYLCKPFNGGYYEVRAFAERHGFDPESTPWNEMSGEAQNAFLYGEDRSHEVEYESRTGKVSRQTVRFAGFYNWIGSWDIGGTYTDYVPCERCSGSGLREEPRSVRLAGVPVDQLLEMPLSMLADHLTVSSLTTRVNGREPQDPVVAAYRSASERLGFLNRVGLGYLGLNRQEGTLSAGEAQRVRLAGLLGSGLAGLTVLLDEPSRGLHPVEIDALIDVLGQLRDRGTTVVVIEHEPSVVRAADHVIEMGPGAGADGGRVVYAGPPSGIGSARESRMRRWVLSDPQDAPRSGGDQPEAPGTPTPAKGSTERRPQGRLILRGASGNNLKGVDLSIPFAAMTGVCGPSGSGKSTLVVDTLARVLAPVRHTTSVASEPIDPCPYDSLECAPERTLVIGQSRSGLSHPGGFLGVEDPLLALFASAPDALERGITTADIAGRCESCNGRGEITQDMGFLPSMTDLCEMCQGTGLRPEHLNLTCRDVRLGDLARMTITEIDARFGDSEKVHRCVSPALELGLGYLTLRQPRRTLSGGEAQRLRIASELRRPRADLYILDEPTVGQGNDDVLQLIRCLWTLVNAGHTVLVVEHHPLLLAACDWIVELGPGAAADGGRIVAEGSPAAIGAGSTQTAPFIAIALEQLRRGAQ